MQPAGGMDKRLVLGNVLVSCIGGGGVGTCRQEPAADSMNQVDSACGFFKKGCSWQAHPPAKPPPAGPAHRPPPVPAARTNVLFLLRCSKQGVKAHQKV